MENAISQVMISMLLARVLLLKFYSIKETSAGNEKRKRLRSEAELSIQASMQGRATVCMQSVNLRQEE